MCIGIPMQVVACGSHQATCEGRGAEAHVDITLVGTQAAGAWLLAFQGRAVRVLTDEEARHMSHALDALEAALAGEDNFDRYFADLAGREPQLPDHLKGPQR